MLAAVFALVAVAPPHGATGQQIVTATSVAAGFQESLSQLQLLSLPGEWGGLSVAQGFTVEMWVQTSNRFTADSWLFSYSVRDPLKGQAEPNELGLAYTARVQGGSVPYIFYKGTPLIPDRLKLSSSAQIAPADSEAGCLGIYSCGHWNHVTATLDYRSGNYSVYLNGTLLYADTYPGEMEPPLPGGQLQLGAHVQTIATQPTQFIASAESSFSVDVFRLYNRTLSAAEVAAGLWAYDPLPGTAASLLLHWRFDTPGVDREEDLSGNGNHGRWGASANLDMPHVYYRSTVEGVMQSQVHRPASVLSTAPVVGASSVSVLAVPGAVVDIILAEPAVATSGCTLLSLPAVGEVEHVGGGVGGALQVGTLLPSCRVRYLAPAVGADWACALQSGVQASDGDSRSLAAFTFRVEASGREAAVAVHAADPCAPPEMDPVTVSGENMLQLVLGGICSDGLRPRVEILTPPQGAILVALLPYFDARLFMSGNVQASAHNMASGNMAAVAQFMRPLMSFPSEVINDSGFVVLPLAPGFAGTASSYMEYRWLSPYANGTAVSRVEVRAEGPSNKIQMLPPLMVTNATDGSVDLSLRAKNNAMPHLQADPTMLFHVNRGTYFGTLYQVGEGGERGAPLSRFSLENPTVQYSANVVPDFRPGWGPAWSSQMTICPTCCAQQETCNPKGCSEVFELHAGCTTDSRSFPIEHLVDGKEGTLYKPDCTNCGRQWFVVGIPEPLYVYGIDMYLASVQGHIASIAGAETYAGVNTDWQPVWQAEVVEPRALASPDRWAPQLCPHYSSPVRWLRFEYDTTNAPSTPAFSGIKVTGALVPHASAVHSPDNRLTYAPLPGVSSRRLDSLVMAASDCREWSQDLTVSIAPPSPGSPPVGLFGELQRVRIPLRTRTTVSVDLLAAAAHLERYLQSMEELEGELSPLEIEVVLEAVSFEVDGLAVYRPGTQNPVPPGEDTLLGGGANELSVQVDASVPVTLYFQASYGTVVTYRLGLELQPVCPEGASVYECATGPADCLADCDSGAASCHSSVFFDPVKSVCVLSNDDAALALPAILGIVAAVIVLVAAGLLVYRFKGKSTPRVSGPPRQGDMVTLVTTDIHGSTTLWDSYPTEVAHGIALHHECLRASLKECNGYEIATEGDSFKCAFRSPEDAICWSILSQMHLLSAQWNARIEDGGHDALLSREDWANCHGAPVLSDLALGVIASLADSDGMESVRAELRDGLLMKPPFDPVKVADSTFCTDWHTAKGQESCAVYGPECLMLPIFRGLRVRVGIHTGLAEEVEVNPVTRRVVYGGKVAKVAKAVADAPTGGQIVMSGDTLAAVESGHDLMARVARMCAGWRHGQARDDLATPAAFSVMSLGTHLLSELLPRDEKQDACPPVSGGVSMFLDEDMSRSGRGSAMSTALGTETGDAEVTMDIQESAEIPRIGSDCALPPALGAGTGLIPSMHNTSTLPVQNPGIYAPEGSHVEEEGGETAAALLEGKMEVMNQLDREHELRHGLELVMLLPWPLKSRALYYPPVSTVKNLTPTWASAPAAADVTILFAFLEGASQLKELGKGVAADALWRLQSVVRSQLVTHNGYAVEVEQSNFVCAFHQATDSVKFAIAVQNMLVHMPWSLDVLGQPWASEQRTATNEVIFRGPRLAIGMCTGNAMRVQPCIRTGRMEYYGPIMNHAARVTVAAHGGQVLLHESTWNAVRSVAELDEDLVLFRNMGDHKLKGISRKVYVIQAIPAALAGRAFPPIKTKRGQEDGGAIRVLDNGGQLDDYLANLGGLKLPKLSMKAKRSPERSESIQVATLWRPKPSRVSPGLERSSSMLASQGP